MQMCFRKTVKYIHLNLIYNVLSETPLTTFPLILKVCVRTTFCVCNIYQHSSIYTCRTICMKHLQKAFLKGKFMFAPSFLECAHLTTCAQLRWNIATKELNKWACTSCCY